MELKNTIHKAASAFATNFEEELIKTIKDEKAFFTYFPLATNASADTVQKHLRKKFVTKDEMIEYWDAVAGLNKLPNKLLFEVFLTFAAYAARESFHSMKQQMAEILLAHLDSALP